MRIARWIGISVLVFSSWSFSRAQDSPSVADAARQARQQKHQSQSATGEGQTPATVKTPHVVTNDEIPEHEEDANTNPQSGPSDSQGQRNVPKRSAEYWKSQILRMKNSIASLQASIDRLSNSIHFAGGNYDTHVVWNERQREKQRQLDNMKSLLGEMQTRLDEMQEAARRQGYGSSVYEP